MSSTEQLEGIWQATAAVVNGEALPSEAVQMIRLTLTATRFTTRRGGETLFDSSYSVNAAKFPNEIEMIGVEDFAGKPALGIYALEAGVLQICYRMPGFLRPTAFESEDGSGAFLITLKRSL
jgi:uncharacterized protein (TIGR03067 family)